MAKAKKKTAKKKTSKRTATRRTPKKKTNKPARPPKRIRSAKQAQIPGTENPNADKELDRLIDDAYDLTLTFQTAQREMKAARDRLIRELKRREIEIYETHDGKVARLKHANDKVTIKANTRDDAIVLESDE